LKSGNSAPLGTRRKNFAPPKVKFYLKVKFPPSHRGWGFEKSLIQNGGPNL